MKHSYQKFDRQFYNRDTITVARDLLGHYLVHVTNGVEHVGKIVEVEAYLGERDLAAHSSKGVTERTKVMFGHPGIFYIYLIYGMYVMLKQVVDDKLIVPHWTISEKLWNIYFWVSDVDGLYSELVRRGAKIDYEPCNQPYGCREFGTQDLDGYDIGFGQVLQ